MKLLDLCDIIYSIMGGDLTIYNVLNLRSYLTPLEVVVYLLLVIVVVVAGIINGGPPPEE